MNISENETICEEINNMDKNKQLDILKIIYNSNKNIITENNNGCFINMNDLNDEVLDKIKNQLEFWKNNDLYLKVAEKKKEEISKMI